MFLCVDKCPLICHFMADAFQLGKCVTVNWFLVAGNLCHTRNGSTFNYMYFKRALYFFRIILIIELVSQVLRENRVWRLLYPYPTCAVHV